MNISRAAVLVFNLLIFTLAIGCASPGTNFNGGSSSPLAADPFLPTVAGGSPPIPTNAVYIVQPSFNLLHFPSYILEFSKGANGNVEPIAEITGPAGVLFGEIAVDGSGNVFAQGFRYENSEFDIYIYPAGATGGATLTGIISKTNADAMCLDAAGKLYAMGIEGLRVYDPTTPAAPPLRTIKWTPTASSVHHCTVDSSGDIYLLNLGLAQDSAILVLSTSGTGNTAPLATISGPATGLANCSGLAVDSAGDIYVGAYDSTTHTGSILVFAPNSTGNVSPVRTISGSNTRLGPIEDVRMDKSGTLYVSAGTPSSFSPHILSFAPGASGNVAPLSDLAPEISPVNHMTENFAKLAVL